MKFFVTHTHSLRNTILYDHIACWKFKSITSDSATLHKVLQWMKTFLFTCRVYKNFSFHVGYCTIVWPNKSEFSLSKHKTLYNATIKTQHHYHHLFGNWQVTNLEYLRVCRHKHVQKFLLHPKLDLLLPYH